MRVLVVGAAIIGSIYGWALVESGHQVVHLVRSGRAAALRGGLKLDVFDRRKGHKRNFYGLYKLEAVETLSPTDAVELVIVPVKHYAFRGEAQPGRICPCVFDLSWRRRARRRDRHCGGQLGRRLRHPSFHFYGYNGSRSDPRRGTMSSLGNALQLLREERKQAQQQVGKLDVAIGAVEAIIGQDGLGATSNTTRSARVISAASRRRMARAQKTRWAKERQQSRPSIAKKTNAVPAQRVMSAAARRKIAAYQRARWAKIKSQQKKAA
jgi:Ketopantoate reductase PanE/ApbA